MLFAVLTIIVGAFSYAQAGQVTIKGDSVRVSLVSGLINDYFPGSQVSTIIEPDGEYVTVTGSGGFERIHFTPPLVERLQKLVSNPRAGDGLMNICPTQARQLSKAVGPMRIAPEQPMRAVERKSVCDQGGCYGKVLSGDYQTLQPYEGVRLVANTSNPKYPENSVTFKIEYHRAGLTGWTYGTDWGPTIVIRNPTMENPLQLVYANAGCIMDYLQRATALKTGQPGNEGDSCWEVVILRDGTIYKDESPAEARFYKN